MKLIHKNGIVEINSRNDFNERFNNRSSFGSFQNRLMDTIQVADSSNLYRLYKSFPDVVTQYLVFNGNTTLLTEYRKRA